MKYPRIDAATKAVKELAAQTRWLNAAAIVQAKAADRYYRTLQEIATIFDLECWTVKSLPIKLRRKKSKLLAGGQARTKQ